MSDRDQQDQLETAQDSGRDRPANASELGQADIPLERERNSVRREQEGLKDRKARRWAFVLVLGVLGIAVATLAAVIAVALAHGDYQRAVPLVPVAGGAGWLGVSVWNRFSNTIIGFADTEDEPLE